MPPRFCIIFMPPRALFCAATYIILCRHAWRRNRFLSAWRLPPLTFGSLTPAGSIYPIYPP